MHPALYHYAIEALSYLANLCYICHLWPNWEMCLCLFNMGHMIYVLDRFFNVNLMVASILRSDYPYLVISQNMLYIYVSCTVFQSDFNCDGDYVIWRLFHCII